jgi:Zn-dependent protease with chaperone function/Tfp pilus assembly major pilin PilA
MKPVYKTEDILFAIALVLSLLIWLLLLIGTVGMLLVVALLVFIVYLFAHSAYISYIRGNGVRLSKEQYPDLYAQVEDACKKLGMQTVPDAYLVNSNGVLNALATRFLWRNFLVLYADIVNALDARPGAVSFYIGHELGHIIRGHLAWGPLLAPGKCFPYLGFAYRRAQEYTCDLHGLACCNGVEDAQRALVVLAAGKRRWKDLNFTAYGQQLQATSGFWMSFHEITSDYPWLVKRVEHITAAAEKRAYKPPRRNFFAWIPALLVFRAGPTGMLGALIWIYIVGIMAAIAIPAYQDYIARSQMSEGIQIAGALEQPLAEFYQKNQAWPGGLAPNYPKANVGRYTDTVTLVGADAETIGVMSTMKSTGVNRVIAGKTVEIWTRDGGQTWNCGPGSNDPVDAKYLPASCRDEGAP